MMNTGNYSGTWRFTRTPALLSRAPAGCARFAGNAGQRGKRGGVRVMYYHAAVAQQLRMLLIYRKGLKDDLTAAEKRTLRELNRGW